MKEKEKIFTWKYDKYGKPLYIGDKVHLYEIGEEVWDGQGFIIKPVLAEIVLDDVDEFDWAIWNTIEYWTNKMINVHTLEKGAWQVREQFKKWFPHCDENGISDVDLGSYDGYYFLAKWEDLIKIERKIVSKEEMLKSLSNLTDKLLKNQKPIDPDIQKIINEDFWDMV